MISYKIVNDKDGNATSVLKSDGWCIPFDESNTDYQEYLKWVAEGNTPLPADQ
jgi:hypothetical protein